MDVQPFQSVGCASLFSEKTTAQTRSNLTFNLLPFLVCSQDEMIEPVQHTHFPNPNAHAFTGIVGLIKPIEQGLAIDCTPVWRDEHEAFSEDITQPRKIFFAGISNSVEPILKELM